MTIGRQAFPKIKAYSPNLTAVLCRDDGVTEQTYFFPDEGPHTFNLVTPHSSGADEQKLRQIIELIALGFDSLQCKYFTINPDRFGVAKRQNNTYRVSIPITSSLCHPDWVAELYDASRRVISDDDILAMFDALEEAIYTDIGTLDETLKGIDVDLLAPEFVVGIPRALYPLREHLSSWSDFVSRGMASIAKRGSLDPQELFQGLSQEPC